MASYPRTARRPSRAPRGLYRERYDRYMDDLGYAERYDDRYSTPPRHQSRLSQIINWAINLAIVAFITITFYLIWPAAVARWQNIPEEQPQAPTVEAPRAPLTAPQTQPRDAASDRDPAAPIEQAPAVAPLKLPQSQIEAPQVAPVLPTAEIAVPRVAAVAQPNPSTPLRFAPGSVVPTAEAAPTVATTAPMVEGRDYQVSVDGRCVLAINNRGRRVQFCQDAEWTPGAQSSVADYLRTGMIAGEEVK